MQIQTPSELNADLSFKDVGNDISCNLASTNIERMLDTPDFEKSVETAIRMLTNVSDSTSIEAVPTVKKGNDSYHSVGLGAMGLHTALAKNQIHYDSEEAVEFVDAYFRSLRFYALKASNKLAKERGETFHEFEKSEYADGSYLERKYINVDEFQFTSDKVKGLFNNVKVPTRKDWAKLNEEIKEHGLYNAYLLAVAPNGSISYINETSSSLHPIVQRIEKRQEGNVGSVFYPTPHLSNDTIDYFKSAYDMDQRRIIDVYAKAQQHIDQGMSLTLFMRSELPEGLYEWKKGKPKKMTTRDLNKLRNYAWTKGVKSIYYVRTHSGDNTGLQDANMCESCAV